MVEDITPERREKKAKAALRKYSRELTRKRILQTIGYGTIGLLAALLVMILSGTKFNAILGLIGLEGLANEFSGIYTDCSKPENRGNPICYRAPEQTEKTWREVTKKASPFQLTK